MEPKQMAQQCEQTLAGLVSDLRLTTDFEEIHDTLLYLADEISEMMDEAEYYWTESQGE